MGPYGPSVEERNRVQLEYLKKKYGDHPLEELIRMTDEALMKQIEEEKADSRQRKTA